MSSSEYPLSERAVARPRGGLGLSTPSLTLPREWRSWLPLVAVTLLALGLNSWHLSEAGYGNTYYAAAVRSMTMSWKNFFFGAFDPGGFITVDKPPAFLWVDALSARIFGYSTWSILLPSALAGAATVALLWLIVRRYFGVVAATIAGLVLALTPITVAVSRLNLPEPFFILALLGAASAIMRSHESRRWWAWLALAGFLVGVAFNTKMLAGWIPGPAMALAVVVGAPWPWRTHWRRLLGSLAVLGVSTVVVSASWMLIADAWPASSRPYIGGSTDNTVSDLVLGYNGFGRVEGETQGFGGNNRGGNQNFRPPANAAPGTNGGGAAQGGNGFAPPAGGFPGGAQGGAAAAAQGPGGIVAGVPGPFRMFDAANGGQIAWFMPFAVIGAILGMWSWRRDRVRLAAVVLFLGWVLLYAGVFSYAQGIYHSYYTSALAPGVAALVGIGSVSVIRGVRQSRWWLAALAPLVLATLAVQLTITGRVPDFYGWVRPVAVVAAAAGCLAVVALATFMPRRVPLALGAGVLAVGLLALPGAWSLSETANASLNASLPQAGPRGGAAGRTFGSQQFDNGAAQLAAWLKAHNDSNVRWQLVATSAQNGSTLIAEYGVSVMAMGGFSGRDNAMTLGHFADLVQQGEVRYVLGSQNAGGGPGGGARGFGGVTPTTPGHSLVPGQTQPNQAPSGQTQPGQRVPGDGRAQGRQQDGANSGVNDGLPQTPGQAFGGSAAPGEGGSNQVLTAVRSVCTPVTDSTLPANYSGGIYDCQGKAAQLRSFAS